MAYDARRTGKPGYVCHYCSTQFRGKTVRSVLQHTSMYHQAAVKKFENHPLRNPLVCGSCLWYCDTDLTSFKKHIKLHLSGSYLVEERRDIPAQPVPGPSIADTTESYGLDDDNCDDMDCDDITEHGASQQEVSCDTSAEKMNDIQDLSEAMHTEQLTYLSTQQNAVDRFLLRMYSKGSCSAKQIQEVVESVDVLNSASVGRLETLLGRFLNTIPDELKTNNPALEALQQAHSYAHNMFVDLQTDYQRMNHYTKQGLIPPTSYSIGVRQDTKPDGSQVEVEAQAQYVSVISTLQKYREHYQSLAQHRSEGGIASYVDTDRFRTSEYHQTHPNNIMLILYHDDIEVANVLGSRAGVYKMTMFYYSIHGQNASKLQSIHLAIVCHATDLKQFGYSAVLKPFIDDMSKLYHGVSIGSFDHSDLLHATLEHIAGDNLAVNALLGMNQSFSAGYFCKLCYIPGSEVSSSTRASGQLPRCRVSQQFDAEMVKATPDFSTRTGVKNACPLDELEYFSGVESTVPDIMHDILEGVGKLEVKYLLDSLIEDKVITLDTLNSQITQFNYGRHEASNRPSLLRTTDMKQSASQMWCLIRFLPQLIGGQVPTDQPEWAVFLTLRTIMDIVFAPKLTEDVTYTLDGLIDEHHTMFQEIYGEGVLTAKWHFMTHYGQCIRQHGPLVNYWCMRYESKHRLAKSVTSTSTNFRNIPLTIARQYQLTEFGYAVEEERVIATSNNRVSVYGTTYVVGDYIVLGVCPDYSWPVFGRILEISVANSNCAFKCKAVISSFSAHYHAYEVQHETQNIVNIDQSRLPYKLPATMVTTVNGLIFLCIRHLVLE